MNPTFDRVIWGAVWGLGVGLILYTIIGLVKFYERKQ